jgi:ankyrin repeat protein
MIRAQLNDLTQNCIFSKAFKSFFFVADIVRLLLDKGADVTIVTNTMDTPLHGSVLGNQPEITDMLINAGE